MTIPFNRRHLFFGLFLAWSILVLARYLIQIPLHPIQTLLYQWSTLKQCRLDPEVFWDVWRGHLSVLVLGLGFLAVVLASGRRILLLINRDEDDEMGVWAWSLAAGFILWGTLAASLAFAKVLTSTLLVAIFGAAFVAFLWQERARFLSRLFIPFKVAGEWHWSWRIILLFGFAWSLISLSAPEISWDAMTHQLSLPVYYLLDRGFFPVERIIPAHSPSLGQMVYVWGQALGDDRIARSCHFAAHIGVAAALVSYGTRLASREAGAAAAAFYWAIPFFLIQSWRGYVDHFVTLLAVLGLLELVRLHQDGVSRDETRRGLVLSVVALGFIGAFKYSAPMYWLAGIVLLSWGWARKRWGAGALFGLAFAAAAGTVPWLLKNWAYTGNPVYPYLADLFPTFDWTAFDAQASGAKFPVEGLKGLLRIPSVLYGIFFRQYGGALNEDVGPLFIVLLPLLLRPRWLPGPALFGLFWAAALPFLFWTVTSHQLRLIPAVFAFAALAFGAAWSGFRMAWPERARVFSLLVTVVLGIQVFSLAWGVFQQSDPLPCALGLRSRGQYLETVLKPDGTLRQMEALDRGISRNARVLMIGQGNGYYLKRRNLFDFDYVEPALKRWAAVSADAAGIHREFRRRGVTHILYHGAGSMGTALRAAELGMDRYRYTDGELAAVEQFFLGYTRRLSLSATGSYHVYEVAPRDGFAPMPPYLPGTESTYLEAYRETLGLKSLADLVGRKMTAEAQGRVYQAVCRLRPTLGMAWFQAALAEGDVPGGSALASGKRGLALNGDEASWSLLQGQRWLRAGRAHKALPFLERSLCLSPERAEAASNLAVAYYNERLFGKAVEAMREASRLDPLNADYPEIVRQWTAVRTTPP